MIKYILGLILGTAPIAAFGQYSVDKFFFDIGLTTIPLKIERTNVYRWMLFPSGNIGIRLSDKITLSGSYLFEDLWHGNYPGTDTFIYSEMPRLKSYQEALLYEGSKFGSTHLANYIFAGLNYTLFTGKSIQIDAGTQLGIRFGYTQQLSNVIPNPLSPAGFKSHPTSYESKGLGLNIFFKSKLFFIKSIYLSPCFGTYVFGRWPRLQPYGNMSLGMSF